MQNKTRVVKYLSFLICFVLLISACGCGVKQKMGSKGSWSIYLYVCGSDLETKLGSAGKNIDELLGVKLPENVKVILQTGGAAKWRKTDIPNDKLCRWEIKDGSLQLLEELPQANMGEAATFSEFLNFGVKNYPAEKMCVVVWDHGNGSLDGVCNDQNYNFDALSYTELNSALATVSENMTDRFELFGFDACLMANYEMAVLLSPYARYFVASEEIVPCGGWNYVELLNAIANDKSIDGGELGKAICDGYYKKCEESGTNDNVTLSVVNLQRIDKLSSAFNKMAKSMLEYTKEPQGIRLIAQSAINSQKYGGNSAEEGYSNIVDLGHFAKRILGLKYSEDFIKELEKSVEYKVCGKHKSNSSGISFYYPLRITGEKKRYYYNNICPSEEYKNYLYSVYENIPQSPIEFDDSGSIADDGSFKITLSEKSKNYICSVEFNLLEFSKAQNTDEDFYKVSLLGRDNDIFSDWENLSFHSNFRGIWVSLNGCLLNISPIEKNDKYIIFTAPIVLNGEQTNLRFAFVYDNNYTNGGYYKIIGAWNGIDAMTGMSDKDIKTLKKEDVIEIYRPYRYLKLDDIDNMSKKEYDFITVPQGEYSIEETPLSKKHYAYQYVITDVFGNEYFSDICWFEMTSSFEELIENPLEDGQYAAKVHKILNAKGSIVN